MAKVTMIGVNMKLLFFLVFSLIHIKNGHADDILGCGGFVKSHVTLDFSKIEIGLYTKDGSLKEKTECAPTNGYYFLPLYEKGDYVLKVHPPAGWSFEPAEVNLNIDGETDACSVGQDINFQFNGFGITGRVITAGQKLGPSGVSVQLVNDKGEVRNTVTTTGGDFHFTPVIPGKYTVKASHPRWKLEPAQAVVQVKEGNTALPTGVLAVKGYDVKGSVTSFGAPMSGLYVLLYAKDEKQLFRVEGCKTALLQGVPDSPICHSVTDSNGEFSFGLVPAGHYSLRALSVAPGQNELSLNVRPEVVPFSVLHDSLYIKNAFEVSGFTVVGSLLASVGGAGVGGARVELDGRAVGTTDAGGKFTLPALKPGNYLLNFLHEKCEADTMQLQVTPAGPTRVPHAAAARWRVCGAVSPPDHRDILIEAEKGPVRAAVHSAPENDGKWCTFLPPGVYVAKVELSEQEQREGMQFFPVTQKFSVGNGPVDGVSFSQLKGTVSGRVVCLRPADCNNLPVMLRPLSPDGGYIGTPMKAVVVNGEYSFKEVPAGSAELSVPTTRLCWREARLNVAVAHEKVPAPAFHHTGYVLRLSSQHELEVEYTGPDGASGVLQVSRGASSACVPAAGRYTLAPRGCHQFRPPTLTAATAANDDKPPSTVYFAPVAHAVTVRVLSPVTVNDLTLTVGGTRTGPLTSRPHPDGGFIFEHTMYMADGEVSVISAQSSSLLFEPAGPQQVWGIAGCQAAALTLRAVRGLTKSGRVVPAVEGATVTLTGDGVKLTQLTTKEGTYSFGPLDASKDYTVTLEKESYVFSAPDDKGNVVAKKLAEITVELVDDADGTPLQGALVSVSGGTYRRNALAGPGGRLVFAALSPNQYYVKPNMKEYRFTPPHTIVALPEGHSHHLALRGVRVAWSCVGSLVSLGGAGRAGALLAAVPTGAEPHCAVEEATTEANGAFRIRGLLPNCVYTLQLKESSTPELAGLKLAKAPPTLEVKDNKDIENVRLIAIQPAQLTDGGVVVRTPSVEHYKTLKLTLAPEAAPHSPVYTVKLDSAGYSQQSNPGLAYTLPRLPADNKTYVLQLESTLSKSTHSYEDTAIYFNSDGGFKSFFIEFLPKVKSSEQELRQTSLLVVPLLGLLAVMYLHRDALLARALSLARAAPKPRARSEVPERPEGIPGLNVPGKRVPKKKAL